MKTKILFLGLILSCFAISCGDDDSDNTTPAAISTDEAKVNAQIDQINDDVSDAVEREFDATNNDAARASGENSTSNAQRLGSTCATITRIPGFATALTPGTPVVKTIDFGIGCTLQNGNVLKGKIIISFTYQPDAASHTIIYSFDDFYHNNIKIAGDKTFTRTMSVATEQSPSHPIVTMTMQLTATFPNARVYTRTGTRTREMIEGYSTPLNILNDVHRITGEWTTTYPNTSELNSEITTPLLVKMACFAVNKPLLVQGVITFTRNDNTATLDYGNGTCDNLAVYTINGNSYNIVIGN